MRWKNQGTLETYGVRLVGWPVDIPMQNPSTLSAAQNTQILNALNEGTMQFLPIGSFGGLPSRAESTHVPDPMDFEETTSDMDDYVKYDDLPISEPSGGGVMETSTLPQVKHGDPIGFMTLVLMLCLGYVPWFRRFAWSFRTFALFRIFRTFHVRTVE
jgi:hypothetical protein